MLASYNYDEAASTNGKGQRTSISNASATTRWQYDNRGRVTQATYSNIPGLSGSRSFGWTYDSADRVVSATYPNNEILSYTYDGAWRNTSVCTNAGAGGCYAGGWQQTLDGQGHVQSSQFQLGNGLYERSTFSGTLPRLQSLTVGTTAGGGDRLNRAFTCDIAVYCWSIWFVWQKVMLPRSWLRYRFRLT